MRLLALSIVLLSFGFMALQRSGWFSKQMILHMGIVFQVLVGYAISLGEAMLIKSAGYPVIGTSATALWLLMCGMLIPNTPRANLLGAILTVLSWPAAYWTAQNTLGVSAIFAVDAGFVARQIDAVLEDIGTDAVKVGMLHRAEIVDAVADGLMRHRAPCIVLDPVMAAKDSTPLLRENAIDALKRRLLPLATLVTPNLPEASVLLGEPIHDRPRMERAARTVLLILSIPLAIAALGSL